MFYVRLRNAHLELIDLVIVIVVDEFFKVSTIGESPKTLDIFVYSFKLLVDPILLLLCDAARLVIAESGLSGLEFGL